MSEYLPVAGNANFSDFSYLINNNFYDFKVFIGSFDGRLKLLPPSSIKTLNIEDSIDNPYHTGYIILDNRQDNIESDYTPEIDASNPQYYIPGNAKENTKGSYVFNGDSRDVLVVQIMPKLTQTGANTTDTEVQKYFLLSFNFAIYNTEEIDDGSLDGKFKKLYFWDLDYEMLREKNSYFSTANYLNVRDKGDIQDFSNEERRIPTGAALSAAIAEGLDKNEGFNPTFSTFDQGSTSIFFSAPGNFKCIDTINYLWDRHVSSPASNFSPCILQLDRYPRTYSLRSYYDFFQHAVAFNEGVMVPGNDYLETFKVAGYTNIGTNSLPVFSVEFTPPYAPYFMSEGSLDTYSFDCIAGLYSQSELNSKIVHAYNYNNKEFDIDSYRNSTDELERVSKLNYITPFTSQGGSTFQFGNFRKQNKNTTNEFAVVEVEKNQRLALGLAKNLKNYVYLNNFVTFKIQGGTHRQSGKFIGINRENNKQPTAFDNKFLGVYFVVKVNHIFEDATYKNELVCVKTYLPTDIFLNKNVL